MRIIIMSVQVCVASCKKSNHKNKSTKEPITITFKKVSTFTYLRSNIRDTMINIIPMIIIIMSVQVSVASCKKSKHKNKSTNETISIAFKKVPTFTYLRSNIRDTMINIIPMIIFHVPTDNPSKSYKPTVKTSQG